MASIVMVVVFLTLLVVRTPVCAAMGLASLGGLLTMDVPLHTLPRYVVHVVRGIPLMAVPFFILAATLMNHFGLTMRLFAFANALVGFMRGGLAQVNVVASIIFAGISGAALADLAGLGSVEINAMRRAGYRPEFAAAVTVCSSVVGPIIPPSITFIIYAVNMNVSIGQLFVAGFIPGLVIAALLMITIWCLSRFGFEHCPPTRRSSLAEIARSFATGAPAILTPAIIITGMVSGVATATEAGVLAVFYSLFLGVVYREFSFVRLGRAITETCKTTSLIMYLTGVGGVMAFILTTDRAADALAEMLLSFTDQRWLLLLLVNLALLFMGLFLESLPALLIAISVFGPLVLELGMDPLQFGVVLTLNLLIGMITPPIGIGLFAVCAVAKLELGPVIRATMVFLPTLLVALLILTYVPQISLWLPNLLFDR